MHANYGVTKESLTPEQLKGLLGTGVMQHKIRIEARAPCRHRSHRQFARFTALHQQHGRYERKLARMRQQHPYLGTLAADGVCGCKKKVTGVREGIVNLCTNNFAAFVQANILNQAPSNSIKDTGNTSRSPSANSAMSALTGAAGTTGTAAAVTDFKLGTETETQAATVNANPTTGTTSGSFTVTFTITATADRAYAEVGIKVTNATFVFLICHDTFSTLNVSNTGTLAVTYTFTNS